MAYSTTSGFPHGSSQDISSTSSSNATSPASSIWYPDSGASHHLTAQLQHLHLQAPYTGDDRVLMGNGAGLPILHTGSSAFNNLSTTFHLPHILQVPGITKNLLSVQQFTRENNVSMEFFPHLVVIKDQDTGKILHQGRSKNGLYQLQLQNNAASPQANIGEKASFNTWHEQLGHPSMRLVKRILSIYGLHATSSRFTSQLCQACASAKSHRLSLSSSPSISLHPLDLLFTDVWGPAPLTSNTGCRYLM